MITFNRESIPRCTQTYIIDDIKFTITYMSQLRLDGTDKSHWAVQNDLNAFTTYGQTYEEALDRNIKGMNLLFSRLIDEREYRGYDFSRWLSGFNPPHPYEKHDRYKMMLLEENRINTPVIPIFPGYNNIR